MFQNIRLVHISLLFACLYMADCEDQWDPSSLLVRKISSGLVLGRTLQTPQNVTGFLFQGIPYAQPPTGHLRFAFSEQVKAWKGVLNATDYAPSCYWNTSISTDQYPTPMSEDCLYVNVFTSEKCLQMGNCAVMHYIYGGQFSFGSPRKFIPQIIVDNYNNKTRDIVVVTFAYRMNVFGLLNLNYRMTDLLSPNLALHDILDSLRWTKREIASFGGDPEKVTLMGHSSGSSATQIRNVEQTLNCLRQVNASNLSAHVRLLEDQGFLFHGLAQEIGPRAIVIDTYSGLARKFTPKYPILTGTVSKEFQDARVVIDEATGQVDKLKLWLYCKRTVAQLNYEFKSDAIAACVQEYSDTDLANYLYDDAIYFAPHYNFATRSTFVGAQAYLYQFEYDKIGTAFGHWPDNYGSDKQNTPRHSQELVYLFGQNSGNFTQTDRRLQYLFSEIISNFISTGNPNGIETRGFEVFNPAQLNFFKMDFALDDNASWFIGNTLGYHQRAVQFWNSQMNRVGGPTSPLTDELLVDDLMTSLYIDGDLEQIKSIFVPWSSNGYKLSLCQVLFYVASALAFLFFILLLVECCKRRRKRDSYQRVY